MEVAPLHNFGYIDKTGAWIIPPRFSQAEPFEADCTRVADRETDFADGWKAPGSRYGVDHTTSLNIFLKEYNVFELSRQKLQALLGKPEKTTANTDTYQVCSSCTDAVFIDFYYQSDFVLKYRLSDMPADRWFDAKHPDNGDLASVQ